MTRTERELRERGLTLFATGKFSTRRAAERAAAEQIQAEAEKRQLAESERQRIKFGQTVYSTGVYQAPSTIG